MKKIIVGALLILPVMGWAQKNSYAVKGKFKDSSVAGTMYMTYFSGSKTQRDSSSVKGGLFEFNGPSEGVQQVYLEFKSNVKPPNTDKKRLADARSLYLDKGVIYIDAKDSIRTAVISGAIINTQAKHYKDFMAPYEAVSSLLRKESRALTDEQKNDKVSMQALGSKIKRSEEATNAALKQFVELNPDSYFAFDAIRKVSGSYFDIQIAEPLFNMLSPRLKSSKDGLDFAATITAAKTTRVGDMAPDFVQMDVNDKPVRLSDYKGQYVLIDFWASWCGPCRAENPKVLKAYNAYKDKNFTVLGISIDRVEKRADWLKAIKEDGMPWTQLVDPDHTDPKGAANLYAVKAIPSNYLIDPSGRIIAKNLRGDALEAELAKVLK